MDKLMQLIRFALCVFVLVGSASASAGQNILYYFSQPNDYIGQGAQVKFTDADGSFTASPSYANGVYVHFNTPTYSHWWDLRLGAANGVLLQPGSYENAQRWPGQGSPGLDFSGDGRGCNTVTGRFDVLQLVRDATGAITQLAANWEEHCEGSVPGLFGQIRYNSDIAITTALAIGLDTPLNARGCVEASSQIGALVSMNASGTTDSTGGTSLLYSWSSTTGDVGTNPTFSFAAPLAADAVHPAVVTLSVTDLTNNTSRSATKSVCVSDTTGPVITINSPVPGQNVYGDTLVLDVTIKDAVDKNITQYEILVGNDYLAPISPSTGHARQNVLAAPKANGSMALTVTVRAVDASGNSSQRSVTVTQFP